jgi:ribosomal protein L7/L12
MDAAESIRLARLERQVAFLYRHFGLDPALADVFPAADGLPPEFIDALRRHDLITAIKLYRQVTGAGLADAKETVERIARGI